MGGNNRQLQKKSASPFSVFKFFKTKRSPKVEDMPDDSVKAYKVWPSDEDRGYWVGEPGIDRKASAYIARIHAASMYVSEAERQNAAFPN